MSVEDNKNNLVNFWFWRKKPQATKPPHKLKKTPAPNKTHEGTGCLPLHLSKML